MRVAYLLGRFPVLSETFVSGELREMERAGVELGIFSLGEGDAGGEALTEGISVRRSVMAHQGRAQVLAGIARFARRHPLRTLGGLVRSWAEGGGSEARAFLRVLPWAADPWLASADALHAHFATLPTRSAHLLSRATGIPFGFTAHALDIFPPGPDLCRRVREASWVVTVCAYNRRELSSSLAELPDERVHILPCGVDADAFRRSSPYRARPLRIVAVGRLVEKKGFGDLVAAAVILAGRGVDFELRLLGDGPVRPALEAAVKQGGIASRVHFSGACSHDRILREIEQASLLVQPSVIAADGDRDSMPVVLKEAMSLEIPVIGTDVAGLPEAIGDEAGWLVPPHDPEALADRIEAVTTLDPAELEAVGRRGRARVLEHFRLDEIAGRLRAVFEGGRRG